MKRALTIPALALTSLLALPATVSADPGRPRWSFGFGFGHEGPFFRAEYAPRFRSVERHCHTRSPIYKQVWVPPAYERVIVGRDHCGRPVCRTIQTRCGYYDTVLVGYRCGGCGCNL